MHRFQEDSITLIIHVNGKIFFDWWEFEPFVVIACEQALKVKWEPASMTDYEFEYPRLKSWREILIGQML
jgi:hypothetical protein